MTDQRPRIDALRWFTSIIAVGIIAATYWALVLNPLFIETDVKLWLTNMSGVAQLYLFGEAMQRASAARAERAFQKGLDTPTAPVNETVPVEITQPVEVTPVTEPVPGADMPQKEDPWTPR